MLNRQSQIAFGDPITPDHSNHHRSRGSCLTNLVWPLAATLFRDADKFSTAACGLSFRDVDNMQLANSYDDDDDDDDKNLENV